MTDSTTTHDLLAVSLADEVIVNRDGSTARQSIGNLAAQIWGLGDTDPIAAATSAAAEAAQTAEIAAAAAEAALDATVPAGGWDYALADLTALAAITGMTEGARAYVVSEQEIYRYDGAGWVATGENPLATLARQSDVTDLRADVLERGIGRGPTNDPDLLASFVDEALQRTWLEVLASTLGPSPLAISRIVAAIAAHPEAIASLQGALNLNGLQISFDDPELAFSVSFESLERTWIEVAHDGSVTQYAADQILAGLDPAKLSATQLQTLRAVLGGGSPDVVSVSTPAPPIGVATAAQGAGREYPTVIKSAANPIVELADQTASSIMWPWLVDMRQDGGSGVALFWSTDHASHAGSGTWLATAPAPEGPWTHHGMIFRDDATGGEQHETPSVMWDEVNNRWLMYYQLKFVPGYTNQLTLVATAPRILDASGVPAAWTVLGVAATESYSQNAGDGHSGYFKPFRFDGGWYAHGLYGGTDNSRAAFWVSQDNGRTYQPHPQVINHNQHILRHLPGFDPSTWLLKVNSGAHLVRDGQLWMIMLAGPAASGGAEIPMGRVVACRVGSDGVTFGRAVDITPDLQAWEDAALGVDELGNVLSWGGHVYLVYRQGGGHGGFGLMEVL